MSDGPPGSDADPGASVDAAARTGRGRVATSLGGRGRPALVLARRNLARNRLRTGLAALGIVIGVFAVATLGILGTTIQLTAADSFAGLGNQVVVTPNPEAGERSIDRRGIGRIRRAAGDADVVPLTRGASVVGRGERQTFATLYGVDRPRLLFTAAEGELPGRHRRGAVLGATVAEELGVGVGRTVTIEDRRYRIVAVLAPQDTVSPVAPDGAVLLPPDVFRADGANQVVVRTDSAAAAGEVATKVRASLNARVERVNVLELSAIIERIGRFFALLNTFLIAVGAVSLLVAGVSILNVMLMSVNERRAEIGVLRAVGVRRRAVLRTILAEAALLGVAGASLGVALSVLVAAALYLGVPEVGLATVANLRVAGYLALAFGFGVVVSLASGAYPAWRAADADPVESLRGP